MLYCLSWTQGCPEEAIRRTANLREMLIMSCWLAYLSWKFPLFLCSALSLRVWCPKFRDSIVASSLTVRNSTLWRWYHYFFSLYVGHPTHSNTAPDSRRTETSVNLRESLRAPIVIPYVVRRVLCATSDVGYQNFGSEIPNAACRIGWQSKLRTTWHAWYTQQVRNLFCAWIA